MKKRYTALITLLLLAVLLAAVVWALNMRDEVDVSVPLAAPAPTAKMLERGAYLARAGNCMTCHTARGGAAFAGGRAIATPFGMVYSSNLTPDENTGLGAWSSSHFWRAMHNGRSRDGRLLYPAFPYTNYTQVSREDSDALYHYLRTMSPVAQARPAHTVRWPFNTQSALAVWRALYFSPGSFEPDPLQTADYNRGAYLVQGLGHCAACHATRDALGGASPLDLAGGLIPMQNWYAPSLTHPGEAGVADWGVQDIVDLLKTGVSPRGSVLGPMAEVVLHSTQHMTDTDLRAMAMFLKSLPQTPAPNAPTAPSAPTRQVSVPAAAGARLYADHCAQCHGDQGQGVPKAYPPLAGNRAVTMHSPVNLVQIVLNGGYAPATAANPRPFGMPPYMLVFSDAEMANLLTFMRSAWGHQASEVTSVDVNRARSGTPGSSR